MKKFNFMFALLVSAVMSANAQVATENSKFFDNVSVGITGGASTPLDFNSVFPLNGNAGVKIQKDLTPSFGLQAEGLAIFNDNHFTDIKTAVKATNVGLNGVINLFNAFGGYKGTPRTFEISTVSGLGWMHAWTTSDNYLTAKTGLDIALNLGKSKAHSIVLTPAVYWNLNKFGDIKFDKNAAQLAVNLTYVYHFKTSNGTHSFKTYDVGAMTSEINRLNDEVNSLRNALANVKPQTVEVEKVKTVIVPNEWVVQFAQNDATITSDAETVLNTIAEGTVVEVVGMASPEGSEAYNKTLSEERANNVTSYLEKRGVQVTSTKGVGSTNSASNRLVIVTTAQ
jgi:outer membrane protein OmpA-like peptidoglycan-associated protein